MGFEFIYGKRLLIDGDVFCHQIANANTIKLGEEDYIYDETEIPQMCEELHEHLYSLFQPSDVIYCFSGDRLKNFRLDSYPAYKGNRNYDDESKRNPLLDVVKCDLLVGNKGICEPRLEADDLLGILNNPYEDIIVSIDKDLDTIEGWHFNPVKEKLYKTDESYSKYFLWSQIISGDPVDYYHGISGIGPKKAMEYILDWEENYIWFEPQCSFEKYIWDNIVELYEDYGFNEAAAIAQARCAFILGPDNYNFKTKEIKLWQPPSE